MTTRIPQTSPDWLKVAMTYEGQREIKGPQTAPFIAKWLAKLRTPWKDDETAWCGIAVAGWLEETNERFNRPPARQLLWPATYYRALSWADAQYGTHLTSKQYRPGAICAKSRKGGGHVFLYIGESTTHIFGIGGNTSDSVKCGWYPKSDIVAVVWPQGSILANPDADMRNLLNMDGTPVTNRED